jgi:hypothetical protein
MRIGGLLTAFVALAASPTLGQAELFSPEERAQGEEGVHAAATFFAASLREPSSATFRHVFIGKRPPPTKTLKIIVCGEVNARNAFGGFTGYQAFIVSGGSVYMGSVAGISVRDACFSERVFDTRDYSVQLAAALNAAR